jgi:hypothetical protein
VSGLPIYRGQGNNPYRTAASLPGARRGQTNPYDINGKPQGPIAGALADGDYGDVVVSGSGTIILLDAALALSLGLGITIQASEALSLGNVCNVFTSTGAARVRKANATDTTKPANAFVTAATSSGAQAPVGFDGHVISGLSGLTPGTTYWLDTTGGAITATPPSGDGNGVQEIGVALSATTLLFHPKPMIGL